MNPMDTLVLVAFVLLGAINAASASRIGGTLPFTLLLPPAAVLSVTLLSHPAGLLIAAALTVLACTFAFSPRATALPITSRDALLITLTLFIGLIGYATLQGGVPAPAYAMIIGLTAGCLGAVHALNPAPELALFGRHGWYTALALFTLLTFAIGATFTEWLGLLSAATLLLITFGLRALQARQSPPGDSR